MPLERIVALGLVIVSSILLGRLGPGAVRSWRIYAGTGRRRTVTNPAKPLTPGEPLKQDLTAFAGLGGLGRPAGLLVAAEHLPGAGPEGAQDPHELDVVEDRLAHAVAGVEEVA